MKQISKTALCLSVAFVILLCAALAGCSGNGRVDGTSAPGTSATEAGGENTPIIATLKPAETPSAQSTDKPGKNYVDLLAHPSELDFSASSVEAEGTSAELSASLSFDGDEATRWSSVFYDVQGCWICVQFPFPVSVHSVDIYENKTWGYMLDWEAQYLDPADNTWKTAHSDITSDQEYYEFAEDTPDTYAFRLLFLDGTGITITINEIELTGQFAEVPEGTEPRAPQNFRDELITDAPDELYLSPAGWTFSASSREAEGTESELGPELCFDGKDNTRWSTVFGDLYGAWIAADFGGELEIGGFAVNECPTWGHVTDYAAQVLKDGEWSTIYTGAETTLSYIALSEPVKTTAFRLLFNDGVTLSETVTIWEISLYGAGGNN